MKNKDIKANIQDKLLLTPEEAISYMGVSKGTMYDVLLKDSTFPKMSIGKRYYINKEKLQTWINEQCN